MIKNQRVLKTLAVVVLLAVLGAACSGGDPASTETADELGVSFDGEDTDTGPAAIPTTPPLEVDAGATPDPVATDEPITSFADTEDPWEVDVLHVKDDFTLIPTFDGPNGNEMKLFDQNEIDGTQLEYPLLADTAFGNRLALLVEEFDASGAWAKVQVPIRPNGSTAWVQTAFFTTETHNFHITINVTENTVNVFRGDDLLVEQIAVLGRESRPTPVVRAYIDEKIPGASLSPAYGDWILSIAAFSESLGTFGGGLPKLALHGTNQPELMGQYVSSGCIRIPNEIVTFIADSVPVGTIVDIIA